MHEEEREDSPSRRVDDDRESIWTIPTRLKRWYFALFSLQAVAATAWIITTAVTDKNVNGASEILLFLWQYLAPAAVASATFALVVIDTANGIMVLSTWLQETLDKRRQRQIAEAAAEATAKVQKRWLDWNRRREAAAQAGQEFNEAPPGTSENLEETT